jgi:hypothetical protein
LWNVINTEGKMRKKTQLEKEIDEVIKRANKKKIFYDD